jgi:hypothetical protein
MKYYVYTVNPINDWSGWMSAGQFFKERLVQAVCDEQIAQMIEGVRMVVDDMRCIAQALEVHGLANVAILRFTVVPAPFTSETIFAVEQNKYDEPTYIFSPVPMPWLEPDFVEEPQVIDV